MSSKRPSAVKRSAVLAVCVAVSAVAASAQTTDIDSALEQTEATLAYALGDIGEAAVPLVGMVLLPPDFAFPDDLRYSGERGEDKPIDDANRELIRNVGFTSGLLAGCELEWIDTQFAPMMAWQRERVPEAQRNGMHIAKIGASHGFAMEVGAMLSSNTAFDCEALESRMEGVTFENAPSAP